MFATVVKGCVGITVATVLSTGVWAQNFVPQGDFEGSALGPLPAGTGSPAGITQNQIGGDPWSVTNGAPLSGAQSAELNTGLNGQSQGQLYSNTFGVEQGGRYTIRFQAATSNTAAVNGFSLTLVGGGNLEGVGSSATNVGLNTTTTDYIYTFTANTTGNAFLIFFGSVANTGTANFIKLDNISVIVPELNAANAVMPVTLMLGLLLLAYDRRRAQQKMAILN